MSMNLAIQAAIEAHQGDSAAGAAAVSKLLEEQYAISDTLDLSNATVVKRSHFSWLLRLSMFTLVFTLVASYFLVSNAKDFEEYLILESWVRMAKQIKDDVAINPSQCMEIVGRSVSGNQGLGGQLQDHTAKVVSLKLNSESMLHFAGVVWVLLVLAIGSLGWLGRNKTQGRAVGLDDSAETK